MSDWSPETRVALRAYVRAVALADLWNRGVLDIVVANQKGPLLVYKNTVIPENEWIEFDLEGSASNRSAIGAQVTLFWNGQQQAQGSNLNFRGKLQMSSSIRARIAASRGRNSSAAVSPGASRSTALSMARAGALLSNHQGSFSQDCKNGTNCVAVNGSLR